MNIPDKINTLFPFEIDTYQDFSSYAKELIRHDVLQHINTKGFRYQFRLEGTYLVPTKEIDKLFTPFGTVWGGRETFVLHDEYVIHPIIINSTFDNLTIIISATTIMEKVPDLKTKLIDAFATFKSDTSNKVMVEWAVPGRGGEIRYSEVESIFDEEIYKEAYPMIPDIELFVKNYLESKESVLILHGPTGTGKTRLIRRIISEVGKSLDRPPSVLYSMDDKIFGDEGFFFHFLTTPFDAMVLEDIDFNLKARRNGNTFMYKLLGGSDGFIKPSRRKIIMSTNLPNIEDMDDALRRPGRCFGVIEVRKLTRKEAQIFLEKVRPAVLEKFNSTHKKEVFSLAELYAL